MINWQSEDAGSGGLLPFLQSIGAAPAQQQAAPTQAAPSSGMNYAGLDWGTGASLAPQTLSNGYYGSPRQEAVYDHTDSLQQSLAATPQNAALLSSLGFGGNAFDGNGKWSNDALQFLSDKGYGLSVGHVPGTSGGGRAEYYGLVGPNGQYVQGQSDPSMIASDSLMDQLAPFLLALPAAGGIISAASSGALGATGAGVSSAGAGVDLGTAALGAEAGGGGALGAAGAAEGVGGLSGAADGLGGLAGGAAPTAGAVTLPGVTITGTSAGAAAGAGAGGLGDLLGAAAAAGGAGLTAEQLFQQAADQALQTSGNYYQQNPMQQWATDVGNVADLKGGSLVDYLSSGLQNLPNIPNPLSSTGGTASSLVQPVLDTLGGKGLAGLIGGIAGAVGSGGSETETRQFLMDPRMNQYVYGNGYGDPNSLLGAGQQLWQQNKSGLNPTMQAGLDMQRNALQDPAYGQAYTQMRNVGTGLLSAPMAGNPFTSQQPTMQAGGSGGLLGGGNYADRAKALMTSGRGLLG